MNNISENFICLGIAVIASDNETVSSSNLLTNYSYITGTTNGLLARCASGLGPTGTDDNTALGIWYFNGAQLPYGLCEDPVVNVIQSHIEDINYVGVINLWQCGSLTTTAEGVYTCVIMDSSMMNQTRRLGVYFSGRSELCNAYIFYKYKEKLVILQSIGIIVIKSKETRKITYLHLQIF